MSETDKQQAVQTTGHSWDGDLQEYNNPLPTWWVWAFYGTVAFAVIYWFMYPAWPIGHDYTRGILRHITYEVDGKEKTTHWNTRARLIREMQTSDEARRMREYLEKVGASDYETILGDPEMMAFTRAVGKGLFGDNCAPCHGRGGQGVIGLFPNLADDDWLWGGTPQDIETTIREGRLGFMPAFRETLTDAQIEDTAHFVLSLSGHEVDAEKAARGEKIFRGETGGCYYCHTKAGTGLKSQGAANLTDKVWTIANVPAARSLEDKVTAVGQVIRHGVERRMPSWKDRLKPEEIKVLTVYVHELGGGK